MFLDTNYVQDIVQETKDEMRFRRIIIHLKNLKPHYGVKANT